MKILFLTHHLDGTDGWSRYSVDLIEQLAKNQHQLLCLVAQPSEQRLVQEEAVLEQPLHFLANPWRAWQTAKKIEKIIRRFSPEVIHFLVEPYATCLPFLSANAKRVITIHGTYSFIPHLLSSKAKRAIAVYLTRLLYQRVDLVIAVSHYTKKHLLKNFQAIAPAVNLADKIKVIPNGLNLEVFPLRLSSKEEAGSIKQIIFVGGIKARKGLLEAVEALKHYRDNYNGNFVYQIIGAYNEQDAYFKKVQKTIEGYNLEKQVFFRGRVSDNDLSNYYQKADLFLMLPVNLDGKKFEGFGLVFLEASSQGVPCIGSNNCGAEEAIKDGWSGYVVNPHQPAQIAEKIDLVLNQNKIKKANCLNWAKQNDIRSKVKELFDLYDSLLKSS